MTADGKERAKWAAAEGALNYVENGMRVGLGTGSTAEKFVELLGRRCRERNWQVICVPTSEATRAQAERLGLALDEAYPDFRSLDIVVDGADEIDGKGNLTKGGGGALLREKYVASAAGRMIVIVDEAKHVERLGSTFRIPVEIVAFAWSNTIGRLERLADKVELRKRGDQVFVTDQGNYIADCTFSSITDPAELHRQLKNLLGVVETGIFSGLAKVCVTGHADGSFSIQEF
ncbi:ribose-5-phosphate isomerase RpiA [bacterium]|nr:ribose-5-phosphate isomerase RpiA [bacterium]